ncbi:ABC transporter ATP-binding protein [Stackebrandtia nassauensis]|uniref:ABC transporter related protein n=1 Tax=Stackebrandtia nassauensis (strain DSM 44728 / CIP 108903 / NRRL B-16338 / NBRC 102104 / LLR-40K-21) TaxID=446470 RepID=D3Q5U2_STANL|nr:ATP-binding cassette domain-containing protein [Stackebrandtia nassauensis]ADD40241.1 ABC transporter related protein [Stackebrandtia nassauensis DSM 44728]
MPLIETRALVKEFRRLRPKTGRFATVRKLFSRDYEAIRAVDGIDFAIEPGELVGYLGPNGAGKSTTIKMLTGILTPTSGDIEVAGVVPYKHRQRNARNIGVVFGQRTQLWWDLPLIDSFKLIGKLYQVPKAKYAENVERFTELLDMSSFLDTPVRQLSLGQRMRGDLAAAMLYEPPILYLDEPTVGLDVIAKERIREFIAELNADTGTTIILTTHDMDDVERLCRRLILIDHGLVLYDGPVGPLKEKYSPHRELAVQLTHPADVEVPGAEVVSHEGGAVRLSFDPTTTPVARLIAEISARYEITDLSVSEPDLEDVIRKMYAERGDTG